MITGEKKVKCMKYNDREIKALAVQIRKNILRAIASKGTGHVGGSLSIADALAVLYGSVMNIDPADPGKSDRDYLVLSKGIVVRPCMQHLQQKDTLMKIFWIH